MSHISRQTVAGFDTVHPLVLAEGVKIACQLLGLQGLQVTDYVYSWGGSKVTQHGGVQILAALDAQAGASSRSQFAGMGIGVDSNGQLAIVGDFYYSEQKKRRDELESQLKQVLGGACYVAARALIAQAKGQRASININAETRQLQLVVEN